MRMPSSFGRGIQLPPSFARTRTIVPHNLALLRLSPRAQSLLLPLEARIRGIDARVQRRKRIIGESKIAHLALSDKLPVDPYLGGAEDSSGNRKATQALITRRDPGTAALAIWAGFCDRTLEDDALHTVMASLSEGHITGFRDDSAVSLTKPFLGTRAVFPPSIGIPGWMKALRKFVNDDEACCAIGGGLIAMAALMSIHPYWEGNGRLARIVFQGHLAARGVITLPWFNIGVPLYFNRARYITLLTDFHETADADGFVEAFHPLLSRAVDIHEQVQDNL